MRPILLCMTAFGPYADEQVLDFRELGDERLFLIHGPTGAGKSSILDAICFALYGTSSGDERQARNLRSDFADPATLTSVELVFSLGERSYRVRRVPEQERPKLRGSGTTTQRPEATLWRLREAAAGNGVGKVLASRWSDVTAQVEDLLGFHADQFRQVIMLPQGRFRELLTAGSEQREAILAALFDTGRYRRLQDLLKNRAAEMRHAATGLKERCRGYLEAAGVGDEHELIEIIRETSQDLEDLDRRLETLQHAEAEARAALEAGRGAARAFSDLEELRTQQDMLARERPVVESKRGQLERAIRAAGLADLHADWLDARKRRVATDAALAAGRDAVAVATEHLRRARQELDAAEKMGPERETAAATLARLEQYQEHLGPLEAARQAADEAQAKRLACEQAVGEERQRIDVLVSRCEQIDAAFAADATSDADARLLTNQIEALTTQVAACEALATAQQTFREAREDRDRERARRESAGLELARCRRRLEALRQREQSGRAVVLAQQLEPGRPCPVCGSPEHPDPARAIEEFPDEGSVAAAGEAVVRAERQLEDAAGVLVEAERLHAASEARLDELVRQAGESTGDCRGLRARREELEARRAAIAENAARRADLRSERERLDIELADARARQQRNESRLAAVGSELAAAQATLTERERVLAEPYRASGALEAALRDAKAQLAALEQALGDTRKTLAAAEAEVVRREADLAHLQATRAEASQLEERQRSRWLQRCAAAGFTDEGEYGEAVMEESDAAALRLSIEQHDGAAQRTETLLQQAEEAVKGLVRPDLVRLTAAAEEAGAAYSTAVARRGERAEQLRRLREASARIERASGELDELEQQFALMGRLAHVARGDNPLRLSFQRFVLAVLLDDVLAAASQRLHHMSRGRYRLQRVTDQGGRRSAGGLDLEVEDAYTGKTRPVATLSGGEGFQAALSLALGMAEVVQAYAGGIRLDTIFVDEGFGSLDAEALDLAINTLIDLQASGRLVGIISHVPELAERIDVRLVVDGGRSGSRARFISR